MKDLWAGVRLEAPSEDPSLLSTDGIVQLAIGKRKLIRGVDVIRDVAPCSAGLAEADVEGRATSADQREGAVEDDPSALVLVETQVDERTHVPTALRGARKHGEGSVIVLPTVVPIGLSTSLVCDPERICRTGIVMTLVLEEGDQISHASVAQADDDGILAAVQQFVDLARLKAGAEHADLSRARGQSHADRARPERPGIVRHRHSRALLVRAHGQRRKEAVGERDLIIGTDRRIIRSRSPTASFRR